MNHNFKIRNPINFICTILVLFFIGACKKYPDDKGLNTKKPLRRIWGDWTLKRILLNGNDITQQMNDSIPNRNFEGIVLQVLGDYSQRDTPKYFYRTQLIINTNTKSLFFAEGTNKFHKNDDFSISFDQYGLVNNDTNFIGDKFFPRHLNGLFRILSLQKHNFNLQSKNTNIVYEFEK